MYQSQVPLMVETGAHCEDARKGDGVGAVREERGNSGAILGGLRERLECSRRGRLQGWDGESRGRVRREGTSGP